MRHWEDFEAGQVYELGTRTVTREEIVAFAREFDPQPFHLDEEAAARGPFGGLIASGWHTASLFMRMYVDELINDTVSMGSPGVEELRWLVPVRPGDELRGRVTILEAAPSSTRPDRGTIRARMELLNQRDEVVLTMVARGFLGRRG
ncbi:MAG TPA: MaoC family dehydratase [Gaiellaceae bacterium]|nr:MaoC family dehydratase [Gaiellaceae bacterium]